MQRCWLISRRASLPLRLRVGRTVPLTTALTSRPGQTTPLGCTKVKIPSTLKLSPSLLHTSVVSVTNDGKTPTKEATPDSSADEVTDRDVLDETGFKLGWEEPTSTEGEGQSGEERAAILEAALSHVPTHGWSEEALRAGAQSVGVAQLDDALFPNGAGDLVQFFEKVCHDELEKYLQDLSKQHKGTELLRSVVEYRLRMIGPYLESWPQAMAVKVFPSNVLWSMQSVAVMVDEMWYWAGDRSTDINWYSKRAILSSVYISTELFLIQDKSVDYVDTWKFLDQRFEDIKEVGNISGQIEGVFKGGMDLLKSGITLASQHACRTKN